jgi:hypothetical protein
LDAKELTNMNYPLSKLGDLILFGLTTTSDGAGLFSYNHQTGEAGPKPVLNAPGTILDAAIFE